MRPGNVTVQKFRWTPFCKRLSGEIEQSSLTRRFLWAHAGLG